MTPIKSPINLISLIAPPSLKGKGVGGLGRSWENRVSNSPARIYHFNLGKSRYFSFCYLPQILANTVAGEISAILPVGDLIAKNLSFLGNNFSGSVGPNRAIV